MLSSCGPERTTLMPPSSPQTLRIVSSLPSKGPSARQGALIRKGIDLAIEDGTSLLPGWKIEHISLEGGDGETGEWSPRVEAENARSAAQDPNVFAYIGPYASGAAMISIPILNEAGMLQALPVATWPGLTEGGWAPGEPGRYYPNGTRTLVRLMPPDSQQARTAARKAHDLGATTVTLAHDGSDYSLGMVAAFASEAQSLGLTVTNVLEVNADEPDLGGSLSAGDALFLAPSNLLTATTVAERMAGRLPSVGVFATDVLLSDRLNEEELVALEGWYVIFNGDSTPGEPERWNELARKFQARYNEQPSQYAANAYDLTSALIEAAARVGVDRSKIAGEVIAGTYEAGIGGPLRFDAKGDVQRGALTLYKLVAGKFVLQEELPVP